VNSNRTIAVATGVPGMSSDRKAAVWIGVLYIIGTVAFESMAAWLLGGDPERVGPGWRRV